VVTLYKGDLRSRFRGLAANRYRTDHIPVALPLSFHLTVTLALVLPLANALPEYATCATFC
jgi:hypothetical protein